jgi:hypothetical protein
MFFKLSELATLSSLALKNDVAKNELTTFHYTQPPKMQGALG